MSGRLDDNLVGKLHGVLPPPLRVPKAIMLDLRGFWRSSQLKQSIWVGAVNGVFPGLDAVKTTISKRASLFFSNKQTLPETNSWHLKMDGWNTIVSFWEFAYFQVRLLLVSGSGLDYLPTNSSQSWKSRPRSIDISKNVLFMTFFKEWTSETGWVWVNALIFNRFCLGFETFRMQIYSPQKKGWTTYPHIKHAVLRAI